MSECKYCLAFHRAWLDGEASFLPASRPLMGYLPRSQVTSGRGDLGSREGSGDGGGDCYSGGGDGSGREGRRSAQQQAHETRL